ncbi:uncharacterized protein LOC124933536 [Impatiens glandulifera]|uniref:uncharacterized protein LOC124933536 n=1 Tax=Impatiens glandulifera TaxID=253017 RepID=UPI001FB12D29|nr:uncharacterized protein LOC124933536 [Impatiens glandulifera]
MKLSGDESALSKDMNSMEKISSTLKIMGTQRNSTSKNILMLNLAWEDLEEHLESSKKAFEEAALEFQVREDDLNAIWDTLAERVEEVEVLRKDLETRCEEQIRREVEFSLLHEEEIGYLKRREEQMESRYADIKRVVEERLDDAYLKEERLGLEVDFRMVELDCVQELTGRRSREIDEKQVIHEARFTDLETIQFQIDKQFEDFHATEQKYELRLNELLQREKRAKELEKLNGEKEKAIELKDKELDYKRKNIDSIQVSFDQSLKEFHLKEKQFKLDKEELDLRFKELELEREKLAEKSKEIEQTRESLQQHAKIVKEERMELLPISGSAADINLTVTMDGKNLQLLLNDNANNQDSMHTDVIKFLRMSRDPATVILDAMKGFYPPHLTMGDKRFETSVVMKTCVLLLQQLRRISPQIELIVQERALQLAKEWMNKISHTTHDSLAALGLLNLLASYDLASSFDPNDVIRLLELVAHNDEVYELCGVPCFADMIPAFVKRLIEKTKYLVAVRFICKLNLVDKFPPEPLLRKHLNLWENTADRNEALKVRMTSIEEVSKCCTEFKLQSSFPLSELKRSFEKLSENNEIRKQDDANVECDPLVDTETSVMTSILANMDAKYLLLFLSEHSRELDILQKDVSKVFKMSSDSGRIMIVAIMEDFHGHKIPSCSMRTYLFVLEILAGNIPIEIIKCPVVVEAAMKVAENWKAKLSCRKDPIYILRFLQLVCTYKMTSKFDQAELYNLCCSVVDECGGAVPDLSEIISLSEKFPVSKILNVDQKNTNQSVIPTKAPWNSLPHGTVPNLFRLAVDPARLLLNAMRFLFLSISKDDLKSDGSCTMEICIPLLKELLNVTVDIDIGSIKSEALSFALNWKEKLGFRKSGEAFCFLLFLSICKLGSCVQDEVIHLLNFCKNDFSGNLLRHFGLEEKMIEFIQKLSAQKDRLSEAISLIFAFQLVDKFPPVTLLKSYLACAEEAARKRCYQTTREKAVETERDVLLTVVRCIKFHKLKSLFPPGPLYRRLKELEPVKAVAKKRHLPPDSGREARRVKKVRNGISASPSAPASSSASMGPVPTRNLPLNNTKSSSSSMRRRRYGAGG